MRCLRTGVATVTSDGPAVPTLAPLRDFVTGLARLVDRQLDEDALLAAATPLLLALVRTDEWLPDAYAQPGVDRYQQYLLHCDGAERFSIVAFVWGPGQTTPVHNHGTWGMVGMLRGAEIVQDYRETESGFVASGAPRRLERGAVDPISPSAGDIHQVRNAYSDRTSISIHVYGANIGTLTRFAIDDDGCKKPFVSGYSNSTLPNFWKDT